MRFIERTRGVASLASVQLALWIAGGDLAHAESPPWRKHVVQQSQGTSGQVNTVVANDVDEDGHVDLLGSFDGKVVLYRGPDWGATEILAEMPVDQTGRIAQRGCIHSTLMDVDGDGDGDNLFGGDSLQYWVRGDGDGRWPSSNDVLTEWP